MSTVSDLRQQHKYGRSANFDMFVENAALSELAEVFVAFANASGGLVLMGAREGAVVGVNNLLTASDRLLEAALSTVPPLIIPLPQIISLDNHPVVIVQIPAGLPYVYAYQGRYLRREGSSNMPLPPHDLRRLMYERGEMNYETHIAQDADLDDLDWEKAKAYARNLGGFNEQGVEQILLKRGCLTRQNDALHPTNAGILLFGKEPQRIVIGSDIAAVRFAGQAMTDKFSRQDIGGTLPDQIKRVETFLIDHLRKEITIKSKMAREESYEYPLEAARELLVNAVAHRDYSIRGDNIRLFVFSNRMEVHSPGGLPGPVTIQNIKDERFSRNPIIVQVLSDMHFIEKLGYGVDRVIELMQAQNLREPEFIERSGGFHVVLHNEIIQTLALDHEAPHKETDEAAETEVPLSLNGSYQGIPVNPRQEAAIIYLHKNTHNRITNSDLKALFPDVHPETIRRDLVDLVNKDILVKMGQKRGSYYVLKDAITDTETSS